MKRDKAMDEIIRNITEALGQAQAINQVNNYILVEIVCDLAKTTPDPHKYLANMFERISARADQGPVEQEAHKVNAEFRLKLSTFFATADRALKKPGP